MHLSLTPSCLATEFGQEGTDLSRADTELSSASPRVGWGGAHLRLNRPETFPDCGTVRTPGAAEGQECKESQGFIQFQLRPFTASVTFISFITSLGLSLLIGEMGTHYACLPQLLSKEEAR